MEEEKLSSREKQRLRMKKWRAENQDRIKAYQKQWKAENAEKVSEYNIAYQAEYRLKEDKQFETWVRSLRRNYRLTPDQFNSMWDNQDGRCAICEVEMKPRGRDLESACVDHNHSTGEVRALLCRRCNHGIGHLQDSPEVMRAALKYLEKYGSYGK